MAEEEYYYEDEQYAYDDDGGGAEEETWQTIIENKYACAKSVMDTNPQEAIDEFREVIDQDQDHGKWTFKALKMLARTCQRSRRFPEMVKYYQRAIEFQYADRSRFDTEKAIHKFLDRCSTVPPEVMENVYLLTIQVLQQDLRTFEKLWFNVSIKYVELLLHKRDYHKALERAKPLKEWCLSGDQAAQRLASQLIQVCAIEIQVYTEWQETSKLRDLYAQATHTMEHAIAPPKVSGIIKECGGKMFMRQGLWDEANEAFGQAFRCFDDAGDPRRVSNLKYLVLSSMLSSNKIDPFASNETKSFQNDPEIRCMTDLIQACQNADIKTFERILRDKKYSQSLLNDPFINRYLQPLMRRVRLQVLSQLLTPYRRVRLQKVAAELSVDVEEAESLCVALILEGALKAKIDQVTQIICMNDTKPGDDAELLNAVQEWCNNISKSSDDVIQFALDRR